jgi:uncharacterized membrane protein
VLGAAVGGVLVVIAGLIAHKPLSRVPENPIKYCVGLLLATFGTYWAVEGLGLFAAGRESLQWPGGDLALLVLLCVWLALSRLLVALLRSRRAPHPGAELAPLA